MGTKVHRDSYFYHAMRDLNDDFNGNNRGPHYRGDRLSNGQRYYDGFFERDALRQQMLEHEAIFKTQLHELHRLYDIQRELMEDAKEKKKELQRHQVSAEPHLHGGFPFFNSGLGGALTSRVEIGNSHLSCTEEYHNGGPARFPSLNVDSRPLKVRKKLFDLQLPPEKNIDAEEEEEERVDLNEPVRIEAEPVVNRPENLVNGGIKHLRNGFLMNSGFENRVNGRTIFEAGSSSKGIMHQVYSDQNRAARSHNGQLAYREAPRESASYQFVTSSSYSNSWAHSSSGSTQKRSVFDQSLNSIATIDQSQLANGPGPITREPQAFSAFGYLNSNRNCNSHYNFQRRTIDIDLNEENKATEDNQQPVNDRETAEPVKKIFGIPIFDKNQPAASNRENEKRVLDINLECDPEDELPLEEEKNKSGSGSCRDVMIDLNSCATESDDKVPPCVGRILEIDLEAPPPVQENTADYDESSLLQSKADKIDGDRNAAETIFAMSSFSTSLVVVAVEQEPLPFSENLLLWFADLASSSCNGDIDVFEVTTLQLQEMREDGDFLARPVVRGPEATEPGNSSKARPRRGRAKQRKDFQRDVLPNLSTLSRQEVKEDLQTFRVARRNGGGSRGRQGAATETLSGRAFEVPTVHNKIWPVLEARRSITGWGKTTRRPRRRQRCSASGNNSNPVKASLT